MREEIRMIDLAKTLKEKIKSKTKLIKEKLLRSQVEEFLM